MKGLFFVSLAWLIRLMNMRMLFKTFYCWKTLPWYQQQLGVFELHECSFGGSHFLVSLSSIREQRSPVPKK